jgi:DNA-directed RNA polymerase specialized sigma24 family protein
MTVYSKITARQRTEIYLLWLRGFTLREIGAKYGVQHTTIWTIINKMLNGYYKEGIDYEKISGV